MRRGSLSACGEKQLGVPNGHNWSRNSGTVGKGGVKFSGGVRQTFYFYAKDDN